MLEVFIIKKKIIIERVLFSKKQRLNSLRSVEVIILLDFIQVISKKVREINEREINIIIDIKDVQNTVKRKKVIVNHFNQNTVAECKVIKRLVEKSNVNIEIKRVNSHKKITASFQQNLETYICKNIL